MGGVEVVAVISDDLQSSDVSQSLGVLKRIQMKTRKFLNSFAIIPNAMHPYEARVGKGRQILTSDSSITS